MMIRAEHIDAYDDLMERAEQLCALASVISDAVDNPEHNATAIQPAQMLLTALLRENYLSLKDFREVLDQASH